MLTYKYPGIYIPKLSAKKIDTWKNLCDQLPKLQAFLKRRYNELSPIFLAQDQELMRKNGIPSFHSQQPNQYEEAFSGNITTTWNNFYNKAHLDNDVNTMTLICHYMINEITGEIATFDEGANQVQGGQLAFCDLKSSIDFAQSDGWTDSLVATNTVWHQTLPSKKPPGCPFGRFGFSTQINQWLQQASKAFKEEGGEVRGLDKTFVLVQEKLL